MPAVEQDDETSKMLALQREYERYRAAVEQPLHNVDESTAQRTQAVRVRGLLSGEDIEALHRVGKELARERPDSTIDRSAWGQPEGTWLVTFLNTEGGIIVFGVEDTGIVTGCALNACFASRVVTSQIGPGKRWLRLTTFSNASRNQLTCESDKTSGGISLITSSPCPATCVRIR